MNNPLRSLFEALRPQKKFTLTELLDKREHVWDVAEDMRTKITDVCETGLKHQPVNVDDIEVLCGLVLAELEIRRMLKEAVKDNV